MCIHGRKETLSKQATVMVMCRACAARSHGILGGSTASIHVNSEIPTIIGPVALG